MQSGGRRFHAKNMKIITKMVILEIRTILNFNITIKILTSGLNQERKISSRAYLLFGCLSQLCTNSCKSNCLIN